jgi:exosortase
MSLESQIPKNVVKPTGVSPLAVLGVVGICAATLFWFYLGQQRYGPERTFSAARWIWHAWNPETGYEHGPVFPLVIAGLIIYQIKTMRDLRGDGSWLGLAVVFVGVLFYALGHRSLQPRITMGALPLLLWGSSLYVWGWGVARMLAFPLFFFWMAIPLPSFQQATVQLQLLVANFSHVLSGWFGVETYVNGTTVLPVKKNWEALEIAGGCSGIRSLMALLMISAAWAYVARMKFWKRAVLFLSAIPLAIFGNILRITSIFVIAEYGDAKWARETWHDWSGLLLFYPISIGLLLVTHSVLEGRFLWKRSSRREIRRVVDHSQLQSKISNP